MREAILNETVLKDIALQIVQQGILSNWQFYAFLLALSLLSGAAGAFLSKYWGKRGETAATKTDFDEIIRQLAKTTEVAEQVRSAVSYADWTAREWKTIRRIKLEELVQSAISFPNWLSQQASACNEYCSPTLSIEQQSENKKIREITSPANHVDMISTLYFPELKEQSLALARLSAYSSQMFIKIAKEQIKKAQQPISQESEEVWNDFMKDMFRHYRESLDIIGKIKEKAAEIMRDMQTI